MTTPTTRDFSFKWAYISSTYTTMKYTSTNNIPIWNYDKLQKIVVTNSTNSALKFILFDKSRGVTNPAISTVSSYNLHNELFKFEKLFADTRVKLYGQTYIDMDYIEVINDKFETEWVVRPARAFNITYTYDYFEYDITKKGVLPLQFIFKDYSFTSEDVRGYKTMGYTAEELNKAGLTFRQLLDGGYNIMDELFPVLSKLYSDIDTEFIEAINLLKSTNTRLITENTTLTNQNTTLTAENNSIKNVNTTLKYTNTTVNNTNIIVNNTNITLNNTNTALNNTNILLKDTNNILKNTNTILSTTNNTLKDTNTILSTENNRLRIILFPPGPYGPTGSTGPTGSIDYSGSTGPTGSTGPMPSTPASLWRWAIQEVIRRNGISSHLLRLWQGTTQELITRHGIGLH